jgi:single-strand DNA-binding protein
MPWNRLGQQQGKRRDAPMPRSARYGMARHDDTQAGKEVSYLKGINKVILVGNATRDAEAHQTQTGKPAANIRMATNRAVKADDGSLREETQYHTVLCFDRLAETAAKYVTKGKLLYVEGRLETRQFTDKQGRERELPHVIASDVQFLSSGASGKAVESSAAEADAIELDDVPF